MTRVLGLNNAQKLTKVAKAENRQNTMLSTGLGAASVGEVI